MGINLKIVWRQIKSQKVYSFIAAGSLASGLAVGILSAAYALYETSYDQFIQEPEKQRIYRVRQSSRIGTLPDMPELLIEDVIAQMDKIPEVERVCRINQVYPSIRYQQQHFKTDCMIQADETFFEFFPVKAVQGILPGSLSQPRNLVLTETLARQMFGKANPLGKVVTLGDNTDFQVAAVIADWPENSHLQLDAIFPYSQSPWGCALYNLNQDNSYIEVRQYETYLLVNAKANIPLLEQKLGLLNSERVPLSNVKVSLTALQDIYLSNQNSEVSNRHADQGRIWLLAAITTFTLLIAGINYVNMANALAFRRARETGIKKTMGASRFRLFREHLVESIILTTFASILAFFLAWLLLAPARQLLLVNFSPSVLFQYPGFLFIIPGILLTAFLAGFYPALVLSGFRPLAALQGSRSLTGRSGLAGRGLIILQFAIAVVFITGTLAISRQLNFASQLDLGYNHHGLLRIPFAATYPMPGDAFCNRLLQHPLIEGVAFSRGVPGLLRVPSMHAGTKVNVMSITPDFLSVYQIPLVCGRNLQPADAGRRCLINETAAKLMPPGPILGKKFNGREIMGVVPDFHYASLHTPVEPLMLSCETGHYFEDITIRLKPGETGRALAFIRNLWQELYPGIVFQYTFLRDDLDRMYRNEQRLGELIRYAAVITVLMSCSGLVGLALLTTRGRVREIGIRKVLGASSGQVVWLLTRSFSGLVLVAILAACPVSWYIISRWLENFTRRIPLAWDLFVLAGALALTAALLTVSSLVLRAARTNPAGTLRQE